MSGSDAWQLTSRTYLKKRKTHIAGKKQPIKRKLRQGKHQGRIFRKEKNKMNQGVSSIDTKTHQNKDLPAQSVRPNGARFFARRV